MGRLPHASAREQNGARARQPPPKLPYAGPGEPSDRRGTFDRCPECGRVPAARAAAEFANAVDAPAGNLPGGRRPVLLDSATDRPYLMRPSSDDMSKVRTLLAEHGDVGPQPGSDWRGTFPLPPDVAEYYQLIGPRDVTIAGYGNPHFLPSLAKLWDFQAGYRWNSLSGEPIDDWDDDWLVVADEGGDPFIFDRASSKVLFAHHGEGVWEPEEWFTDLATMAACLAILGSVVRAAGGEFSDADFSVRSEHRERAVARIADVLGSRSEAEAVVSSAGWG